MAPMYAAALHLLPCACTFSLYLLFIQCKTAVAVPQEVTGAPRADFDTFAVPVLVFVPVPAACAPASMQ